MQYLDQNLRNLLMVLVMVGCIPVGRLSITGAFAFAVRRSRGPTILIHRLFSSSSSSTSSSFGAPDIEISPSNHGTVPIQDYNETSLDPRLLQALQAQGIVKPTPIQAHGIPLLQSGHDVMASSRTGSGKTLLFGLPICEQLIRNKESSSNDNNNTRKRKGPSALILNPTRELALQTAAAFEGLTSHLGQRGRQRGGGEEEIIKVALATGGAPVKQQRQKVQQCDVLVATPGRLLQFLDERCISLDDVRSVVVDESDRMVDLGFEPQLRRIAQNLKKRKQQQQQNGVAIDRRTVLCSATFPPEVQRVAADFLKADYYFIAIGKVGATHTGIHQKLLWVDSPSQRRKAAIQEIQAFFMDFTNTNHKERTTKQQQSQVIVFCNTKDEAETIGNDIQQRIRGRSVRVVTGDKSQDQRNRFLDAFRKGKVDCIVATDVAARGLDVPTIGLVVQVDTPRDVDTFVHRVGRTGRAGAKGRAVALVDGRSMGVAPGLVELLEEAEQKVPAWLLGMSYVKRARVLEEEGAIAAGGGALGSSSSSSNNSITQTQSTSGDESFSQQDFRRTADAGSWGAGRDTSYQDFDADAYSSLDVDSVSLDALNASDEEEETFLTEDIESDGEKEVDEVEIHDAEPKHFERQRPSKKLLDTLNRISGTHEVGSVADPQVLSKLSKNQRLRFEYLGMFEFEDVSDLLMNKGGNDESYGDSNAMPRVLMVAEKPSIAKAIADALSGPKGPRQRRGISRALPVYEFHSNRFVPVQDGPGDHSKTYSKIIVTSVVGHVFSLGFDQKENQSSKDPADFFHIPVIKQEEGSTGKLRVVEHLRALAAECDHLVLWLDCDAEGENIAHEVMAATKKAMEQKIARDMQANPDSAPQRRVHRAQFSAITQEALRDAFGTLVEPDAALSRSVDARQELDLRVGVALTRLLTWKCVRLARQNFSAATKVISYGPCQTPALSFCVDRASEIESFSPCEYWKVDITAKAPQSSRGDSPLQLRWLPPPGSSVTTNRGGGRRTDKGSTEKVEESASFDSVAAQSVAKQASKPNAYATVVKVESFSEKINAPHALNTVALLAAGSKAMGMSPKKVMQVAEKLYSGGLLSYPRTETTRYDPKGFDVRSVLRQHASHPQWGRTASHLLRTKYAKTGRPPSRGKDAGDHPPITALRTATREEVGGGAEWRVFEFVCRTFLGSLSDELVYTRQVAQLEMGDEHKFEVEQIQVEEVGFAAACPWVLRDIGAQSKNGKNGGGGRDKPLKLEEGMKLPISNKATVERCLTRPPPFLQEHELIERMDTNKIGTDASMATHVNNIVERGYVVLTDETGVELRPPRPPRPGQKPLPRQIGRYMVPTSLGISLIDLFNNDDYADDLLDLYDSKTNKEKESPSLLARPAIRAQMEKEVKQIANEQLDKEECVEKNLVWFQARYDELAERLTRQRINEFGKSLSPIKESLRSWRKLGAFEEPTKTTSKNGQNAGAGAGAGARQRGNKNGKKKNFPTRGASSRQPRRGSGGDKKSFSRGQTNPRNKPRSKQRGGSSVKTMAGR